MSDNTMAGDRLAASDRVAYWRPFAEAYAAAMAAETAMAAAAGTPDWPAAEAAWLAAMDRMRAVLLTGSADTVTVYA